MPSQTPGLLARYGLTRAEAHREAWVVTSTGRRYGGAAAVNHALGALGAPWRQLGTLYSLPVIRGIEDAGYHWIAAHRGQLSRWIGVTPECDRPGVDCSG